MELDSLVVEHDRSRSLVCVCVCVRACVRAACVRACVRVGFPGFVHTGSRNVYAIILVMISTISVVRFTYIPSGWIGLKILDRKRATIVVRSVSKDPASFFPFFSRRCRASFSFFRESNPSTRWMRSGRGGIRK